MQGKSIFEALAPYSDMVIDQSRGVTIGTLQFASAQDYWSTGGLAIDSSTAGQVDANTEDQLFVTRKGQSGNVITARHNRALTNNKSGDRMASNQVYVGLALSFDLFKLDSVSDLDPLALFTSTDDLNQVAQSVIWSLNIGDGIEREIAPIANYAGGCAVFAAGTSVPLEEATPGTFARGPTYGVQLGCPGAEARSLPLPVIFPPNIQTDIRVRTGGLFTLGNTSQWAVNTVIAVKATFEGFMMTLPA